jgi:diguanylate cyclase (GGDEF)-like protein
MKLWNKLIVTFIIFGLISVILTVAFVDKIIMKDYYFLEEQNLEEEYSVSLNSINTMIKKLEIILVDWARWDDTYCFVENENEEYIKSNIVKSTFIDLEMNYIAIHDIENNLIFAIEYDYEDEELVNIPIEIIETIEKAEIGNSVMLIDGKTLIVSKEFITDSESDFDPNGTIVFAYYLDNEIIYELNNELHMDIHLTENSTREFNDEKFIIRDNDNSIVSFYIPYANSERAIKAEVIVPNSISELGEKSVKKITNYIVLLFLILLISLYYGLDINIVKRLKHLSSQVTKITVSKDLELRVDVNNRDEVTILQKNINYMLDDRKSLNDELLKHATLDIMTGLFNRRIGEEILENLIDSAKENKTKFSICFIDINNLKTVNDELGHNAGDDMIINLAKIIKSNIRENDLVCRLGGDEFLLVFHDYNSNQAELAIKRINNRIDEFNRIENHKYKLSVSVGIEEYDGVSTMHELIKNADAKMYYEKKNKRNKNYNS